MKSLRFAAACLAALFCTPAWAESLRVGDIIIEQAWGRATMPSARTAAAYLTVRNTGTQPDRIVTMETPVAGHAMAHETLQEGNVLKMQESGQLTVPPGGTLEMKPGGTHVMLMDLKGGLKVGQEFPLTIVFERAGTAKVPVKVGKPGAMGPE